MDPTNPHEQPIYYYDPSVTVCNDNQFITGRRPKRGDELPPQIYSQALDTFVIGCVDIVPIYKGLILIGQRNWEPQPNWWCFGGRMHKGELYQEAAIRNTKRELFRNDSIELSPDRFTLVGIYNLIWDKRAQNPIENGCQVISITMALLMTDKEIAVLRPNEEYCKIRWIDPKEVYGPDKYHPCLVQMVKDASLIISKT